MSDILTSIQDDLLVQAMIFDMDIDWETLELVEKKKPSPITWLDRWLDKMSNSDHMPDGTDQQGWE